MKRDTIKFTDINGVEREAEVVLCFETNNKQYIIYTFNEKDENNMVALYSSEMIQNNGNTELCGIETEEEWAMVKDVMKEIIVDWKED